MFSLFSQTIVGFSQTIVGFSQTIVVVMNKLDFKLHSIYLSDI